MARENDTLGGEKTSVQDPMVKYAVGAGWEYISPEESTRLRGGQTGIVFRELFVDQMQKLNPGFMDHLMAEELIKRLERIPPNIEGNLAAWEYLRGLKTVFVPDENRERNARFIDTDNIDRNTFHVTDEFRFTNGSKSIRLDVAFLVNGVPVLMAETKSAHKIEGIAEALDQVRRYHRDCPEILAVLQVYALTHIAKYYYGATWNTTRKYLYDWKEEAQGDFETLVKAFLDRKRVAMVLTGFILFTRKDDEIQKVILRPHQMRAVDRVVQRAANPGKKRGLIWHTQGSGKTYTMIVAAQKIIENPLFENPTVIMMVDRNELEAQLFGNLSAVGIEQVEVAHSKAHLRELLSRDRRGLIVTMIHKFEAVPEAINTRHNIFVLVDEAHRTTGGTLGNYLMSALPNATYIGFTGTPIDRTSQGKGTFIVFGADDPPQGYMDKYSISESIEDGTTVPLHYTLAPNDLQVDRETLDREFLSLADAEGVSDIDELNKVLQRAVNLRNMLKNRDRVEKVARYVAEHYRDTIEPMGYKAFLVGVDREACALYKQALDEHLPVEYSQVVYSAAADDPPHLARYHLSETREKLVRKAFLKPDEMPKILIVTEKLLTGFDAPILYCMYLDKPMRDHVLLQAIARVNRPYEDAEGMKKPSGFVLDFVGIFGNLEKALAFDSQDIEGVVHDIQVLENRFVELMADARRKYLSLMGGKARDKAVEAVLEHFRGDEEARHEFYRFYREVSDIYDILSPDASLRPYIDDMNELARMYGMVRSAYEGILVDREFFRKVARLVQEHTSTSRIRGSLEVYQIDGDTIRRIDESGASDTEKVFNLIKSIQKAVADHPEQLYLISIGEKAERIAELYRLKQRDTIGVLEELKGTVEEINAARKDERSYNMPVEVFSIFWVLKSMDIHNPEGLASCMSGVLEQYPHWKTSEGHERKVKQGLYKALIQQADIRDTHRLNDLADRIMRVIKGGSQ